jgi:hypothetical protein
MAVKLSALRAGCHPSTPGRFPVLISARNWVDFNATAGLEGLGHLKNPMTSLGTEHATWLMLYAASRKVVVSISGYIN